MTLDLAIELEKAMSLHDCESELRERTRDFEYDLQVTSAQQTEQLVLAEQTALAQRASAAIALALAARASSDDFATAARVLSSMLFCFASVSASVSDER